MKAFLFRFAALALIAGGVVQSTRTDSRGAAQEPKGGEMAQFEAFSATHCVACHSLTPLSPAFKAYEENNSNEFIKLDEYSTWSHDDLHAKAFANITPGKGADGKENLASRMEAALRRNPSRGDKYQVTKADECLACHAVDTRPSAKIGAGATTENRFLTTYGVGCEACHGMAEKWFTDHFRPAKWRLAKSVAEKSAANLNDLRDPAFRTELCSSCHVGDRSKGRFVTHEMFAAGHPPLAPFETGRFGADQPAHYRNPTENAVLKAMAADDAWKNFHFLSPASHSNKAREIALGSLAAFKSSIQLIASEAKDAGDKRWFDLATFDCYACHHDLKYPGERQERGYANRIAGRPVWKPGFDRLLFAVLDFASAAKPEWKAKADGIRADLAALDKTLETRPLGDAKLVGDAAGKLLAASNALVKEIGGDRELFTTGNAAKLFDAVAAEAKKGGYIDFEAALPLAWAMIELAKDAKEPKEKAKLEAAIAELSKTLPVEVKTKDSQAALAGDRLKARMKQLNEFESAKFAEAAKKFAETVK